MKNILKMNSILVVQVAMLLLATNRCAQRTEENFNRDWRFTKGEQAQEVHRVAFDDSGWEAVRLPHDWAISGPFNAEERGSSGKLPWQGVGWYRKTFELEKADGDRRVYFDFDGVMAFPKVYVNGQLAGEWDYGYMSFRVDATPYVKFGGTNVIAVLVDTRQHGTRWYPGAGIYRKVTMTICDPVHVAHWGSFVTTPKVSDASATVRVRSTIENHLDTESKVAVEVALLDPDGHQVATGSKGDTVPAGGSRELDQSLVVRNPQRWDIDSPKLYTAKTTVRMGDKVVDTDITTFGIRTFRFTANDGFYLNGRRVQLYGVCLHHDHGPLGAAFYRRAMERQLEIMRDMGCNAIRTSHNPPAPELLELCDRMGFVVWDEAFDKWDHRADRLNGEPPLEEFGEKQLRNFVMRDRNHPSIVIWSIANENGTQGPRNPEGKTPERVKFMSDFVRKYDPTRPVTLAENNVSTLQEPILDALEVISWNYSTKYLNGKERYPDKSQIFSESASALSTRGFYELPLPGNKTEYSEQLQVNSYGHTAVQWGDLADVEFHRMETDRFVAGEFVWTGFDYLGEPTPFTQQAKSSYFGIVDLCGIPKDRFYLYRSHWRKDATTVHILPHWNWPDRIGKNVPVYVYTNGNSAELFLNGKSLGRRTKITEIPELVNLAEGKPTRASSEASGSTSPHGNDADPGTSWLAASDAANQWWQVDLGEVQPVRNVDISFDWMSGSPLYLVKASTDGSTWQTIVTSGEPTGGFFRRQPIHAVNTQARYLRVEFTEIRPLAAFMAFQQEEQVLRASIRDIGVYSRDVNAAYYEVMDKYQLRWHDVVYEPGELKAVAYKDGRKIGEAVMRTAGEPAEIRLTPDRQEISATGEDLSYILVEAADEDGTLCPLADNLVHFEVRGPAQIAGVGNGNPLSLEPFQANSRKLFYGKAMLILRSVEGERGRISVTAKADGLKDGSTRVRAVRYRGQ